MFLEWQLGFTFTYVLPKVKININVWGSPNNFFWAVVVVWEAFSYIVDFDPSYSPRKDTVQIFMGQSSFFLSEVASICKGVNNMIIWYVREKSFVWPKSDIWSCNNQDHDIGSCTVNPLWALGKERLLF